MNNVIKAEWYKLRKDRSLWTLLTILILISLSHPLLIIFDKNADTITVMDFYRQTILGGNNYIIRLVPCVLAGFFISSEYAIGTMKSIVASGNSRVCIYFAKLMVYSIGAILIAFVFPLVFTGAVAVFLHFNGMPTLSYFASTVGLTALYTSAFASIMALFATIFTESGKAIGFMLFFFLLFDSLLYTLSNFLPVFEVIFSYSIFKLFLDIGRIETIHGIELVQLIAIPIITFIIFGILGSIVFQKKEIK
ncbi:ABC transporter permease [Lysinibacillus sp. FSL K6-0232]|uniref:ABC transporter permease n=1 Tax=Lysinibacillus sp. FSL K6-0232 TaxID=2921425 RepID=UPI0030FAC32D